MKKLKVGDKVTVKLKGIVKRTYKGFVTKKRITLILLSFKGEYFVTTMEFYPKDIKKHVRRSK